jgi:futalosine hydrolase
MFRRFAIHSEICAMYIVIAAATSAEIKPFVDWQAVPGNNRNPVTEVLITGVGVLPATFSITRIILEKRPDLVIQAGIAGSFDPTLKTGEVVMVTEEIMGDYGAMEKGEWKDIFDLQLMKKDEFPFNNGRLINPHLQTFNSQGLLAVRAITVNEIITSFDKLSEVFRKYNPQIENMEGAALHYSCLQLKIPFLQIRGISNQATERNKSRWKIEESIASLNKVLITIIEQTGK